MSSGLRNTLEKIQRELTPFQLRQLVLTLGNPDKGDWHAAHRFRLEYVEVRLLRKHLSAVRDLSDKTTCRQKEEMRERRNREYRRYYVRKKLRKEQEHAAS